MSSKPVYSEQYFINLMAAALAYGTVYVISDANTYRDEASAVNRCRDFMKLRQIVRYATITASNCPASEEELNALMVTVESKTTEPVKPKETPKALDLAAAEAALAAKRGKTTKVKAEAEAEAPAETEAKPAESKKKGKKEAAKEEEKPA